MQKPSRRQFLHKSATSAAALALSTSLGGCLNVRTSENLSTVTFKHGVASGDPLKDALIIWTRVSGAQAPATVAWELATDQHFKNVVRTGVEHTDDSQDFTVKVDVRNLQPDTEYFYRFIGADSSSPSGRGKTLAIGATKQVNLAVMSCANYPTGYFNACDLAAKQTALDAVLHLGDYIYEYAMGGYATERADAIGRKIPDDNNRETITLSDYRKRYALYRTDASLQRLHAAAPFIVVWDDHEVTNDAYNNGAENHQPDEGDFFARRAAAVQAYYEWLPIRPPMGTDSDQIYRSFDFGDLLSLHMLDTRVIAREKQLEYADYMDPSGKQLDTKRFTKDLTRQDRALLGKDQLTWLTQSLAESTAKWQLLGQQVLMTKMWLPAEIFTSGFKNAPKIIKELGDIKTKQLRGSAISKHDLQRLNAKIPYNLDAWDGYPAEREILYAALKQLGKKVIVLAGDTHNAWQGKLRDQGGNELGVEFATASVTSPGMEKYLSMDQAQTDHAEKALPQLIDDLEYCNLSQRGYLALTLTRSDVKATWKFIDNIESEQYQQTSQHSATYMG